MIFCYGHLASVILNYSSPSEVFRPSNGRVIPMLESDKAFTGSVPENYDRYLVPLIFEPYAANMAERGFVVAGRRARSCHRYGGCDSRFGSKTVGFS